MMSENLPVSVGHVGWVAGYEYYKDTAEDLFRAHKSDAIDTQTGTREGRFFSTAAVADKMLAHLGLAKDASVEANAVGYQRRRDSRIERLDRRAENAQVAGAAAIQSGSDLVKDIPFGQPILVGHHSEKGDRARRSRAASRFEKGAELLKKARYLEARAKAAADNTAISSDDPLALQKLTERLSKLKDQQEWQKLVNKHYRSGKLGEIGFSADQIERLTTAVKKGYSWEQQPYPGYQLSGLSASIRRIEARIQELQTRVVEVPVHEKIGHISIDESDELNRVQIRFPRKPPEDVQNLLSHSGFHWSHEESAWQAQRSPGNLYRAEEIVSKVVTGKVGSEDPELRYFEEGQVLFGIKRKADGTWSEERCMGGTLANRVMEG